MSLFLVMLFILSPLASMANGTKDKVNILTWWGYIDATERKEIEKKCNTEISVDEYYSNSEFLRRWDNKKNNHDLILYSSTIFNLIKSNLEVQSKKQYQSMKYHPIVNTKVHQIGLTSNTRIFLLSLSGFLIAGEAQDMESKSSFPNLIKNSKNKIFVIMDDAVEGIGVLQRMELFSNDATVFDPKKLASVNARIMITNDLEPFIKNDTFSMAYIWSGGALKIVIENSKKMNFQIHPQLSHVTADLVSVLSTSESSSCVFDFLSSEDFLNRKQSLTFYFSPFGSLSDKTTSSFRDFHNKYFKQLSDYNWLKSPAPKMFFEMDESWKKLKLFLNK